MVAGYYRHPFPCISFAVSINFLKDLSSSSLPPLAVVLPLESECKGITFFIPLQNFLPLFFEVFLNALIRREKNFTSAIQFQKKITLLYLPVHTNKREKEDDASDTSSSSILYAKE